MTIENLFPIKIFKTKYDRVGDIKEKLFPKLDYLWNPVSENNQQFMANGNLCSYHEENFIHKRFPEETQHFIEFANTCGEQYWKELDYYDGLTPYVAQSWVNKTPKGGWIESHLHLSIPFSGVLYVDASPAQGNIILENPLDQVLASQPIKYKQKYQFEHEIQVETGDYIMFPAYLRHRVLPNTTDRDRLILGVNYGSRGWYWASNWVNEFTSGTPASVYNEFVGKPPTNA
jgi:uncharacterized protein (TIGR02466 family)